VKEVLARVKAVLARTDKVQNNQIVYKDMKVDLIKKVVTVKGKELPLTKTEYDILKLFVSNPGVVFSRHKLIEHIWPKDVIVTDRTVDVNITRLRKKMVNCPNSICTRQGFGYYLE
jgi:DNA-binding response OmpR family regulator